MSGKIGEPRGSSASSSHSAGASEKYYTGPSPSLQIHRKKEADTLERQHEGESREYTSKRAH